MTFTIPNLLSLLRMGLVPLFIITVVNSDWRKALLIFLVAGITDALDGFIARFWNQKSLLGSYLDPIADKLLLTSAYVVLSIPGLNRGAEIPLWITILVIARDVLQPPASAGSLAPPSPGSPGASGVPSPGSEPGSSPGSSPGPEPGSSPGSSPPSGGSAPTHGPSQRS